MLIVAVLVILERLALFLNAALFVISADLRNISSFDKIRKKMNNVTIWNSRLPTHKRRIIFRFM